MRYFNYTLYILWATVALLYAQPADAIRRNPNTAAAIHLAQQKNIGLQSITENAARAHVGFLAHDLMECRQAGMRGSQLAQQYIVSHMRQLGLQPYESASFLQPFNAAARPSLRRSPRYYVESDSLANIAQGPHHLLSLANVIACIPGTSTDEVVVVGAHFDHEGFSPTLVGDQIYNGADDNASGVSAVLQIMQAFVKSGVRPRRTIVFAFWDGEELGLLGSRYFVNSHKDISQIKGYLNFDMVGGNNRPDDSQYFVYFYTESHPRIGEWLKDDIAHYQLDLHPNYKPWDNPVGGSDQSSFARHAIPIVWYHTDAQPHYNQPSDEASTINYPKLTDITRASFLTAWHMVNDATW